MLAAGGAQAAGGALDPGFGTGGKVLTHFGSSSDDKSYAVAIQPDGKIVVAGYSSANGSYDFALARYTRSGALDPGFGTGGKVLTDFGSSSSDGASAVAIRPDGKIVVAGSSDANGTYDFALGRYRKSGALDRRFGTGGKVLTHFGSSSDDLADAVAIQPDGKIVVAGSSDANGSTDFALARYTKSGALDAGFGTGGKVLTDLGSTDVASAVAVQPDGKIVVAGFSDANGSSDFALARYTKSGALNQRFGAGGKVLTDLGSSSDDRADAVAIQPDGKIVATGSSNANGSTDFALARYRKSGALNRGFGRGGKVLTDFGHSSSEAASAVAVQSDGKIVVAGSSDVNGSNDFALARYRGR